VSLIPKCSFEVLLSGGALVPGQRVEGSLVLTAPEPIPRTDHVELAFRTYAWAGYGSGKSRSVLRRDLFNAPFRVEVPKELPAGTHRFPFALDVPWWLPPGFTGGDCAIQHLVETRLDVDWAIDPTAKRYPVVQMAPQLGTRKPLSTRSPVNFHPEIVVEISLASTVVALGEPLIGQLALRGAAAARFDAVELLFGSIATVTMGRGDRRRSPLGMRVRIPANALRSGEPIPFQIPPHQSFTPTSASSFIEHDLALVVSIDIPWAVDPAFEIELQVLPHGSIIEGDATTGLVGSERLERIAAIMAQETGLRPARAPALVDGLVGPVGLRISDAPHAARLGIDVDFTFPDVELGIDFHRLGMLEGFRQSPLLPEALARTYLLRVQREDPSSAAFIATALAGLEGADEVRFSDHHLGIHFPLASDEPAPMVALARFATGRANAIGEAIRRLAFPASALAAQPAWLATAGEQSAFLVPSGPSLHGLVFGARVLGGEERSIRVSIRTDWTKEGAAHEVDVDLTNAPLPAAGCAALDDETTGPELQPVRQVFASTHALGDGRGATLRHEGFVADPRALLPAIEAFFGWVLAQRGEKQSDLPYR
jgi:hypothetical protein